MKYLVLLALAIPALLSADNLKSLLDFATENNTMVIAKSLTQESKVKDVESAKSSYYPTIDTGAFYQNLDQRTRGVAGDTYSGYIKVGVDLYDGGKKSNTIEQNKALLESSKYDVTSYKKSLQLSIAEDFYTIKSAEANLRALDDKKIQLKAELERIQKFYDVGSATIDEVDKLQAEYSNNLYLIDDKKFQILSLKRLLSIKTGKKITTLEDSSIVVPENLEKELSDDIKALNANASSLNYVAKTLDSAYLPQLRFENTYSIYDYGRADASHLEGVDNQNKLMLTFNMRLFDNGNVAKQKESIVIQKKALEKQIEQAVELQNVNTQLAFSKINTTQAQIHSAKSSLESANSAYATIAKKYEVGAIDNIAYLDALSVKTNAKAQYEAALNNLQIAYATYYYYSNKNIQEYVK